MVAMLSLIIGTHLSGWLSTYLPKTDCSGIMKPNRGAPKIFRDDKIDLKTFRFIRNGDIITKYEDGKTLYAISTRCREQIHDLIIGNT